MKSRNHKLLKAVLTLIASISFIMMLGTCANLQFLWSIGFAMLLAVSSRTMDRMGMLDRNNVWTR